MSDRETKLRAEKTRLRDVIHNFCFSEEMTEKRLCELSDKLV